jgi:hypothetical protein
VHHVVGLADAADVVQQAGVEEPGQWGQRQAAAQADREQRHAPGVEELDALVEVERERERPHHVVEEPGGAGGGGGGGRRATGAASAAAAGALMGPCSWSRRRSGPDLEAVSQEASARSSAFRAGSPVLRGDDLHVERRTMRAQALSAAALGM